MHISNISAYTGGLLRSDPLPRPQASRTPSHGASTPSSARSHLQACPRSCQSSLGNLANCPSGPILPKKQEQSSRSNYFGHPTGLRFTHPSSLSTNKNRAEHHTRLDEPFNLRGSLNQSNWSEHTNDHNLSRTPWPPQRLGLASPDPSRDLQISPGLHQLWFPRGSRFTCMDVNRVLALFFPRARSLQPPWVR